MIFATVVTSHCIMQCVLNTYCASSMFKVIVQCCCPGSDTNSEDDQTSLIRTGSTPSTRQAPGALSHSGETNSAANNSAGEDEQAILRRILQKTANDVIDVAALESQTLEPREYMERARKYNVLLSQITVPSSFRPNNASLLMDSGQQVEKLLLAPVVEPGDVAYIRQLSQDVECAFNAIQVKHIEDLVVQFN
ncbi:unnamed protein product [Soboliphyme baturini]|uniref:Ragulator complex protein LAMTOR1 n=1 Tax=Soboliphyme baturini TaxID=241478 RepID=A0A183IA33_9BILA|nr:unnamed protein product [Soboliphyme baturini]